MAALEWRPEARDRAEFMDALDAAGEAMEVAQPPSLGGGDGGAPSWWDDDAGAEALALSRRLGRDRSS